MLATLIGSEAALITGFAVGHLRARRVLNRARTDLSDARRLAEHDPLTGLPNRIGAQCHYRRQAAAGRPLAAVLVDLDDFKSVNDTWGHHVGDAHLAAVAERLVEACAPIGAQASRLAGDEFLLLIAPPPTGQPADTGMVTWANALLASLHAPLALLVKDGAAITTKSRASAGIALPEAGSTWADLLRRADIALYHAKAETGRAVLHTYGMRHPQPDSTSRRLRLRDTTTP